MKDGGPRAQQDALGRPQFGKLFRHCDSPSLDSAVAGNPSIIARPWRGGKCRGRKRCAIVHGVSRNRTAQAAALDPTLVAELAAIVGSDGIVSRAAELKVYECDGWTIE